MRIFDRFLNPAKLRESENPDKLIESLSAQVEILQERYTQLSDLVPQGWDVVYGNHFDGKRDLDRAALDRLTAQARLFYYKNPLIKQACSILSLYTWAKGMSIKAKDENVDKVLQWFRNDPKNIPAITGYITLMQLDAEISLHGNLFIAFFTDEMTGRVICRSIPFDEIREIYTDPDDQKSPQYYLRQYQYKTEIRRVLIPDIHYKPNDQPTNEGEFPIDWKTSIFHVKTNCLSDMLWGVPEIWSALDYADAYREFLQDWSKFVKALSKFAWQAKTKGGTNAVKNLARGIERKLNPGGGAEPSRPGQVAGVLATNENITMEPVKVAGAAVSVDDARRLLLMVSSGTAIPEIYISGDSASGNFSTSKTMERPLEMKVQSRQELWKFIFSEILNVVIDKAATAPLGKLNGIATVSPDEYGEQRVIINGSEDDVSRTIDISFPPVLSSDPATDIQSLIAGATLNGQPLAGTLDMKTVATQVCRILDIDNSEELIKKLFPDDQGPEEPGQPEKKESAVDRLVKAAMCEAGLQYEKLYPLP